MAENEMEATRAPEIGDNKPPAAQLLREQLMERYDSLLTPRAKELVKELNALPDPLPDDKLETASELMKSATAHLRKIDATRVVEKEPYLEAERAVDGYFKRIGEDLESARKKVKPIYETAHDRRAEAARRQAEEEARKRHEEAERQRREAEEHARKLREEAAARQREAEQAELRRQEEASRLRHEQTLESERLQRESAQNARRAQEEADRQQASAREAQRFASRAANREEVASADRERIETARPAEFARVRTDHGVVSTQVEKWDFTVENRALLPKITLWKYLTKEAIDDAIKAAVASGVRDIRGVRIFQRRTSVIR